MPALVPNARARGLAATLACVLVACVFGGPSSAAPVYRWVDADGVTHLSSTKPPAGVRYERLNVAVGSGTSRSASAVASPRPTRLAAVAPEQAARRNDAIGELQNRECVVALEAIDRLARGGKPVDPDEFRRLQQTADHTCSKDPATRQQQEAMAAKLRVSRGGTCIQARNELAEMLEPGRKPTRERLKAQQQFIEAHCEAPVR
jgi:hypothetical protein